MRRKLVSLILHDASFPPSDFPFLFSLLFTPKAGAREIEVVSNVNDFAFSRGCVMLCFCSAAGNSRFVLTVTLVCGGVCEKGFGELGILHADQEWPFLFGCRKCSLAGNKLKINCAE